MSLELPDHDSDGRFRNTRLQLLKGLARTSTDQGTARRAWSTAASVSPMDA